MASKNQVTLTFAGDADKLSKTFDAVGADAKTMASKVDGASRDMASNVDGNSRKTRRSLDDISDGADRGEQRIIGLRDAFTGTGDTMKGIREGDMVLFLTGIGDLASAVANFAGPVLSALASKLGLTTLAIKVKTIAMTALNTVMKANPMMLVVTALALLAGALVVAYRNSSTFRNIVQGAFGAVKTAAEAVGRAVDGIVSAMLAAWRHPVVQAITLPYRTAFSLIKGYVNLVLDVLELLPGALRKVKDWGGWDALRQAFGNVFSPIKSVINSVSDAVQNLISKVDAALSRIGDLGRKITGLPSAALKLLPFANGGIVTGPTPALIGEAGPEAVIPLTKPRRAAAIMRAAGLIGGGGGGGVTIRVDTMNVRSDTDVAAVAERLGRLVALAS